MQLAQDVIEYAFLRRYIPFNNLEQLQHPTLQYLLKQEWHYNYHSGPQKVRSEQDARERGVNCAAFAHLGIQRMWGAELPPALDVMEMLISDEFLTELIPGQRLAAGDVAFFGKRGVTEFRIAPPEVQQQPEEFRHFRKKYPGPHLALFTGEGADDDPLFLHANFTDRGVSVWPLSRFLSFSSSNGNEKYGCLYLVRRVKTRLPIYTQLSKVT